MEIKEVQDKNSWESFLSGCKDKTFLQSWNWGEFQKMMGNKIWRLGVYDKGELLSVCLITLIKARRGRFFLIQHGPNIKEQKTESKEQVLKTLLDELKNKKQGETADFIRMAPLFGRSEENNKIFRNLGFENSPMHASAYESTWKLDITSSEEELLKNMRKTTRYLIRQAQKDADIETFRRWSINDVDIFYQIHQEVVKIQRFTPFSLEYFKNEFSAFLSDNQVSLFFGKYKGQVTYSSRFKKELPLIMDVPEFIGIRIHGGNDIKDTSGCVLVAYNTDWKGKIWKTAEPDLTNLIKQNDKDGFFEIEII